MQKIIHFIRRHGLFLPIVIVMTVTLMLVTYLAGTQGTKPPSVRMAITQVATRLPPQPGTPVARYFQVDPGIVAYLDAGQPSYGVAAIDVLGIDLQPIGAFLPRTGLTQFALATATPLPTVLPYPTSPPLPIPGTADAAVLTAVPTLAEGLPGVLPNMAQDQECAPSGLPAEGLLTQRFHLQHPGIDIGVPLGTPVIATHSGQVIFSGWNEIGYGYLVIVQSGAFITYYAHNTSFNVADGQMVGKGSIIAWSGSTGNSTGPHIHYETRINDIPVDPLTFENRGFSTC